MSKSNKNTAADYSKTLYLPQTAFPMRANLPAREPKLAQFWENIALYKQLRADSAKRELYVLHDGPPYANGNIHIGHALNKILKDAVCRSKQMQGYNANYVPGWDCHGLPIEWKIEEKYRAKGKNKDEIPVNAFRRECRDFAEHWVGVQAEEFKRLGIVGNFERPYKTMDYSAEARIAAELLKFAASGQLYRGSKPVMWSVVERTALAEAEVEYHDHESDAVWVKFPIAKSESADLREAFVVIWTTTPWTLPANRAVCYSAAVRYGLYEIANAENDFGPQPGEKLVFAEKLAESCAQKAKLELRHIRSVSAAELAATELTHPLRGAFAGAAGKMVKDKAGDEAYAFRIPLLQGSHVTDDAGTGFVHTAPSHGREDFDAWIAAKPLLEQRGISADIPFPVDGAGYYTKDAPGMDTEHDGAHPRVLDDKGKQGSANKVIISALIRTGRLFARGRLKHSYPHSWRSKKPIIFRNTPQWFVAMDKVLEGGKTLRECALSAIDATKFIPPSGQNRLRAMVEARPDWVLSRQRVWGVPIAVFANDKGEILQDKAVNARILEIFAKEGADSWFAEGARERFLGKERAKEAWQKVDDILDVWFDSGCTHAFTLEDRENLPHGEHLQSPADVYLEGSDQHRGWFQSSLLESCGTRGRAPYKSIVTHGFTLDDKGKKMSKSLGNVVRPQDIIAKYGADILRLWVLSSDYREDQKIGNDSLQTNVDSYRKLRNTIRFMLGVLPEVRREKVDAAVDSHIGEERRALVQYLNYLRAGMLNGVKGSAYSAEKALPELERFMLHRLYELNGQVTAAYNDFDFKRVVRLLLDFANGDLSAFYFDIRKDTLYCDAPSSRRRLASLHVIKAIFERFIAWLAPILPFTAEEAWQYYHNTALSTEENGAEKAAGKEICVHRQQFPETPADWQVLTHGGNLGEKWEDIRKLRSVVTAALEQARAAKHIGSSLEALVTVYVSDKSLYSAVKGQEYKVISSEGTVCERDVLDMADICIVSGFELKRVEKGKPMPKDAFTLPEVEGVGVVWEKAADKGYKRCARSWRWTQDIGSDPAYPEVSVRDAAALREKQALKLI